MTAPAFAQSENDPAELPGVEAPQTLFGEYRVCRPLGAGGMGQVYLVQQIRTERAYALKLLHPEKRAKPQCVARFQREALLLAQLNHENIVTLHDLRLDQGEHSFLVMEYIEGRTLRQELEQHGTRSCEFILEVLGQLCRGLEQAHRAGIIHRDLKPENIMLTCHADGRMLVKILDFGVARLYEEDGIGVTTTEVGIGTAAYMSPEQARGERRLDARSDIFALGVLCYEMLSGKPPFEGASYNEVLFRVANQEHKRLELRCPGISSDLLDIVETALEKDPAGRFSDVGELLVRLPAAEGTFFAHGRTDPKVSANATSDGETGTNFDVPLVSDPDPGPGPELGDLRGRSPSILQSWTFYLACLTCLALGASIGHGWQSRGTTEEATSPGRGNSAESVEVRSTGGSPRTPRADLTGHSVVFDNASNKSESADVASPSMSSTSVGDGAERRPVPLELRPVPPPSGSRTLVESPPSALASTSESVAESLGQEQRTASRERSVVPSEAKSRYIRDNPYLRSEETE